MVMEGDLTWGTETQYDILMMYCRTAHLKPIKLVILLTNVTPINSIFFKKEK